MARKQQRELLFQRGYIALTEAARKLGVSRMALHKLVNEGSKKTGARLPSMKVGDQVYLEVSALINHYGGTSAAAFNTVADMLGVQVRAGPQGSVVMPGTVVGVQVDVPLQPDASIPNPAPPFNNRPPVPGAVVTPPPVGPPLLPPEPWNAIPNPNPPRSPPPPTMPGGPVPPSVRRKGKKS